VKLDASRRFAEHESLDAISVTLHTLPWSARCLAWEHFDNQALGL
jgi:hypothetical protein